MTQEEFDYLLEICDDAFARYGPVQQGKVPFEELTEIEQVFVCIWSLTGQVDNGGFHQYYFNATGDLATETVTALNQIGAKQTADIVIKANSYFQNGVPSKDRESRIEQLGNLTEQAERELEDLDDLMYKHTGTLYELMYKFVMKRKKREPKS